MEKKNVLPNQSGRVSNYSLRGPAGFGLTFILLTVVLLSTLVVQPALAGGGGANLYVATTGVDSGNCLVNPCRTIAYAMNQASSYDNIRIAAGTYYENLVMNENLDFYGAGMTATILDGGNTDPVIYDGSYDLLLMDMTIRNGYYPTGSGGGISNWGGALNMTRVKVTGNVAHFGGGVFSNGLLNMTDCMISANQAVTYDTTDGYGGGIFLQSSNTANLNNVTIYGNTASGSSGGLHNQRNGAVNLTNVTITNNLADANGALSTTNSSTLTIINSTIVYNYFHSGGSNGGIGNYATTNFKNTIVAANQGTNCFNSGSGILVTQGSNLDSGNTCGFNHPSDYRNTDPLLGPPADNGGYTLTHALLEGSPAIDSGTNVGCTSKDQRGMPRPQDGNLNGVATCDIGAYEYVPAAFPSSWIGSASIASDQNVVAVARPHLGSEVASYIGSAAGATTQYVPMLFKGAFGGTYNAALYIQNASASAANLSLQFTNDSGTVVYTKTDTLDPHASKGYWLPGEAGLPNGFAGGVKVTSTQPILALGRPHIGAQVMTYNGMSAGALTAWLPMFFKDGFGSYNSALYIQNVTGSSANLSIEYINLDGTVACTDNDTLGANASRGYWSLAVACDTGSLPSGFVGGVKVTSTQNILAVGRAHLGTQITTYNGSAAGATSAYVPMLFKNAFGGSYDAALYLQNVSGSSANVQIEYLNSAGTVAATQNVTLAAKAISSIWLPTVIGLPDDFAGGARISSTQNVIAVGRPHLGSEITTYNGASAGGLTAYLPMLFKDAYGGGYDAAFYVQNTSGSAANVEISFYDSAGVLSCIKPIALAAGAIQGFWMPTVTCEP